MPPKPWETNRSLYHKLYEGNVANPMEFDKSQNQPIIGPETQKSNIEINQSSSENNTQNQSSLLNTGLNSGIGSSFGTGYGGYGGGYGGYGGYGGGYGGGGLYGGGYGGMGMMGGYGGMGMMGMGGDPNNPSNLDKSLRFLQSFSFVVNSLCDVARNLEMNAEGLHRFWQSIYGLCFRVGNFGFGAFGLLIGLKNLFTRNINSLDYQNKKINQNFK